MDEQSFWFGVYAILEQEAGADGRLESAVCA